MHTIRESHSSDSSIMTARRSRSPGARRARIGLLFAALAATGLLYQPDARAYSGSEHMRFPDQAYQVMNILRHGGGGFYGVRAGQPSLTTCPASICAPSTCRGGCNVASPCAICTQWNRYVDQMKAAPAKLDNVMVDLSDPAAGLKAPNCAGVLPTLTSTQHLAVCRAGDLPFAPLRKWGENANECYFRPGYMSGGADQRSPEDRDLRPFYQELPSNYTGSVLGKWATGPDDEFQDTALWFRPTNLVFASELKSLAEGAVDVGLTIIFAPIVCLGELIFSGHSCVDDAKNFSHLVDPITVADQAVGAIELATFGNATLTSDDWPLHDRVILQGLWHFASVARTGQFNRVPGYKGVASGITASGGPPGWSVLDTTTIVLCDLLGLTIQPDKSQGAVRYTNYADGQTRTLGDWIDATMGHAEFEPVDNLARWGWDQFASHVSGAKGLGWVLHAIGDATQPHHTAAVLGYGHGPWERFALLAWQQNFLEDDVVQHYPHLAATIAHGFHWWKFLDDRSQTTPSSAAVGDMVEAIARETFALPVAKFGHAFQEVNLFDTPSPDDKDIHTTYDGEKAAMRDLMERGIGASIGFLAKASDLVPAAPGSPCACAAGASRLGRSLAGDAIPARDGLCHACGTDVFQALPLWNDGICVAVCPPDKPTPSASTPVVCTTTGACPDATPLFENGVCVDRCSSATAVVVNNRNCVAGPCPANTTMDGARFCVPQSPAKSPAVCGAVNGDVTVSCCGKDGGLCGKDTDCCSQSCRPDSICRTSVGGACTGNIDCLSNVCTGGKCQLGHPGTPCGQPTDCISGKCVANKCPLGDPGSSCTSGTDCRSAICGGSGPICIGRGGEPCAQNNQCNSSVCANGICAGLNGDTCTINAGCLSGFCISGVCKGVTGSSCQTGASCVSGSCLQFICQCSNNTGACITNADCCTGQGTCNTSQSVPGTCFLPIPG